MTKKEKSFDEILIKAVDEALASLGESARQSIYFHLQDKFRITKKDIPNRLEEFAEGLEKIFGLGAHFIEILIMKNLFEKTGQPLEWNESKELVFTDYVKVAKESFLKGKEAEIMEL